MIHLAEASEYEEIIDAMKEGCEQYLSDKCDEAKHRIFITAQTFLMKLMMDEESKTANDLINDVEKFSKVHKLFDFEKN